MKRARTITIFMIGALAAACASNSRSKDASADNKGPSSPGASATAAALPDAALPRGACGMILWTLDVERPIPIFRAISQKGGEVNVDGAVRKLTLADADGSAGFGVYETQTFSGEGITVTVRVRFGLGFEGGSYLERGLVSIEKPDGWKTVIPAAGIAGCRAR
jgi:hypothetical protein